MKLKTKTKHTPGPWSIEKTTDHDAAYRVMDEQEVTVALCYQQPFDTWMAKDNAHLIAAAPELLQCARAGLKAVDFILRTLHADSQEALEIAAIRANFVAAILKAEKGKL